jgi:hypothetical protein
MSIDPYKTTGMKIVSTKTLCAITDDASSNNYNRILSSLAINKLDPEGTHVLSFVMEHQHAGGQEVPAHVRADAFLKFRDEELPQKAIVDVPMDFWEQLKDVVPDQLQTNN